MISPFPEPTLGRRIAARRSLLGLEQRQVAANAGITNTTLSRTERGHTNPRADTLARIASVLGVSMDSLMNDVSPAAERSTAA